MVTFPCFEELWTKFSGRMEKKRKDLWRLPLDTKPDVALDCLVCLLQMGLVQIQHVQLFAWQSSHQKGACLDKQIADLNMQLVSHGPHSAVALWLDEEILCLCVFQNLIVMTSSQCHHSVYEAALLYFQEVWCPLLMISTPLDYSCSYETQ